MTAKMSPKAVQAGFDLSEDTVRMDRVLLGCVLIAATGILVGCTDSKPAHKAEPTAAPSSTQPAVTSDMPKYILAANKANIDSDDSVIAAAARPTVSIDDSKLTTTAIRDESSTDWPAGNYRLTVYCSGTGALQAQFQLGATTRIADLPPCTPAATTGAVDLHLAAPAHNAVVIIQPAENAQAAVAYRIQRLS